MREEPTPSDNEPFEVNGPSQDRILKLMGALVLAGALVTALTVSFRFGAGVLLGGVFAVLNYHWLKVTLKKFFEKAVEGEFKGMMGVRFILRYFLIGGVLLLVYLTGVVPVIAVLFGLAAFALAVVAEGLISIFSPAKV